MTVRFNKPLYEFSENDEKSSGIALVLSNPLAQDLSVSVLGGI